MPIKLNKLYKKDRQVLYIFNFLKVAFLCIFDLNILLLSFWIMYHQNKIKTLIKFKNQKFI